ncbi:hypothetical protein [Streptomyces virginiae]|uniref:hypothetical protein n=1 Tax=Streptomyces virginiae TaxID=1961 RepID=UPI00369FB1B9
MHDVERFARMPAGADLVVVARAEDGRLIGIARSITDGAYATYLGDLAVDIAHQDAAPSTHLFRMPVNCLHGGVPSVPWGDW